LDESRFRAANETIPPFDLDSDMYGDDHQEVGPGQ